MSKTNEQRSLSFAGTAFFDKTYQETLALVDEACRYLEGPAKQQKNRGQITASLNSTAATLYLTSRLTQIMAWMYAQRAYDSGDIDHQEMVTKYRLGVARPPVIQPGDTMPHALQDLLERADRLHRRVARLDDMIAGGRA